LKKSIILIFLFILAQITFGQLSRCSYSYAFGTDEINIYWDYFFDYPEELLGCNVLRYEEDPLQNIQLNQELIVSPDKNFYYLDTFNIIDSAVYFYIIEFVFPSDTSWHNLNMGSFYNIEFNIVGPTSIELLAVPKIPGNVNVNVYWDFAIYTSFTVEDSFSIEMDPFELEIYTSFIFYDFWYFNGSSNGTILTSIFHLKELLMTQTPEYFVAETYLNNYPNPFTDHTNIIADIVDSDIYNITIYNTNGELIKTLESEFLNRGNHNFTWNRKNYAGIRVPNGLYYCIIKSNRMKKNLKLIVQ
jgi:hypothetical protein